MKTFSTKMAEVLDLKDTYPGEIITPGRTDKKVIRGQDPCLPRMRLRGTTSTPKYPLNFGRKISNVVGFHYKNKPAQRIPWQILRLKKYRFVFFGPILPEL